MAASRTLYAVLGLDSQASEAEIEAAYRRLQAAGGEDASLLRVAYDTLRNAEQRAAYDGKLARQIEQQSSVVSYSGPESRPGGWGRWVILLGFLLGGGYWWVSQRPPVVKPAHSVVRIPAPANTAPVVSAEPPSSAAREPAPELSAVGNTSEPMAQVPEIALPPRPPRKQGFDLNYIAWSAFQVRQRNSAGSGVLIGPDRILTNCHVLAGGAMGIVVIHSLSKRVSKVEKYARLDGEDACLLYAPGAGGEVIEWGNSANLKPGEMVYTLGHPGASRDLIWSEAEFLRFATIGGNEYLQTANYCRPGSSGGPLLDSSGRLVGIVTSGQVRVSGGETTYGACNSLTEAYARKLLGKSLFPIGFAPAQYQGN